MERKFTLTCRKCGWQGTPEELKQDECSYSNPCYCPECKEDDVDEGFHVYYDEN